MKLISRYNRYLFPALFILFIISTIGSYFLIRNILQNELDGILLRTKSRIQNYVNIHHELPVISSYDDLLISFESSAGPVKEQGLSSATQFIPEQNEHHISRKLVFDVVVNHQYFKVLISSPLEGTKHLTRLIVKIAIANIFIILLLLFFINSRILSKLWEPFYRSLDVVKSFKVNKPTALNFPATNIDEFKLMNDHFDMAAENAYRDFRNLKEFSENASHEIQTPLAIIHSKLDILVQQEDLTEKQSELLQTIYTSINKLSRIQHSLLLLTKIDNRQFTQSQELWLNMELFNKIEQFQDLWQSRGIECITHIQPEMIHINKELLEILLNNLFSNATRHNVKNGSVHIKLQKGLLEISNTGIETELDPERIFKRFYKNSSNTENNGLGLSIIKEICDSYAIQMNYSFLKGEHTFTLFW